MDVEFEITEIDLAIPAIYLKCIVGFNRQQIYQFKNDYNVNITFEDKYMTDEIYPIDVLTVLYLTGHKQNVLAVAEIIADLIDNIWIQKFYLSYNETRLVMSNISQVKNELNPAEIRVSKENLQSEANHPFYFISRAERKVVLIGLQQDIEAAEARLH
jgi:hypothetical protein